MVVCGGRTVVCGCADGVSLARATVCLWRGLRCEVRCV